jgi:O-acetyl-ADP-ribose deacetylase (regulator of RNase III)
MIEEGRGNLLTADVEALVNTVNTVGVMGKGIALQFKRAYPANFRAYREACARGDVRIGSVWTFDTGVLGPRRFVLNFPTKRHWRDGSRLDDIAAGLGSLVEVVNEHGIKSIAIPALGCGNGGLDWADVRPLIEQACERMNDVRAVIFPPEGAPEPAAMPNATPRPAMTASRALLLIAVARYLRRARLQEVRTGISELEIQKLAYFLQVLGTPLKLTFVRGTYGPYAQALRHVLDALEGHKIQQPRSHLTLPIEWSRGVCARRGCSRTSTFVSRRAASLSSISCRHDRPRPHVELSSVRASHQQLR